MKSVSFEKLSIVNFLSIGNDPVVIDFTQGLHVITGCNKDKPDRQNAVGKSTIADALYFSVFGETLRELKKDLIPNNLSTGRPQVELVFTVKTLRRVDTYKIIRYLDPSKVCVYKNGIDKTRDSVSNTTKYICNVLNATPSIFMNCVIMTINNATPFMAKKRTEKRKFIEDIFGMEVFSSMLNELKQQYNDLKRVYDTEFAKLNEIEIAYSNYNTQRENIISKKQDKLNIYNQRYINNATEIKDLQNKNNLIDQARYNILEGRLQSLGVKLNHCDHIINVTIGRISENKSIIKHNKELFARIGTDDDTCPVCLRAIKDHDILLIKKEKSKIKNLILQVADKIKQDVIYLEKAKKLKIKINTKIKETNYELNSVKVNIQSNKSNDERINQLIKWQDELKHDINALKADSTDLDDVIEQTKDRLNKLQDQIIIYKKQLSKLDVVRYVISEEGVKSYIVQKLLDLLNSRLLVYLKKLDANCVCVFNEFFEEEILNDQNKVCSYFNFSGAERKAIDLACLFAFSDIRKLQGGVSYNLTIYDELFDTSFDQRGIELVTKILQERVDQNNECSMIISHRKESVKAISGSIIYLVKEKGITRRVDFSDD